MQIKNTNLNVSFYKDPLDLPKGGFYSPAPVKIDNLTLHMCSYGDYRKASAKLRASKNAKFADYLDSAFNLNGKNPDEQQLFIFVQEGDTISFIPGSITGSSMLGLSSSKYDDNLTEISTLIGDNGFAAFYIASFPTDPLSIKLKGDDASQDDLDNLLNSSKFGTFKSDFMNKSLGPMRFIKHDDIQLNVLKLSKFVNTSLFANFQRLSPKLADAEIPSWFKTSYSYLDFLDQASKVLTSKDMIISNLAKLDKDVNSEVSTMSDALTVVLQASSNKDVKFASTKRFEVVGITTAILDLYSRTNSGFKVFDASGSYERFKLSGQASFCDVFNVNLTNVDQLDFSVFDITSKGNRLVVSIRGTQSSIELDFTSIKDVLSSYLIGPAFISAFYNELNKLIAINITTSSIDDNGYLIPTQSYFDMTCMKWSNDDE